MNGINRVFLMGYLGANPELQSSTNGKPYVRLSLATHHTQKGESGEREQATTWHRVTVWGRKAELCNEHLRSGSALAVEGYLSKYTRKGERGGEQMPDVTSTTVVAREIHFIGRGGGQSKERPPCSSDLFAEVQNE